MSQRDVFDIRIDRSSSVPIVRLTGELDMASAPTLVGAIAELDPSGGRLAISLADLTFIDSSGLHALINIALDRNGLGPLMLLDVPDRVQRVMQLIGMKDLAAVELLCEADL